ncbi:MAG: hypothetical protein ACK4FY_01735 [Aquificaceae bacterium]
MGVLCLLLDKKKRYFQFLADIFNVTGHKLLIALEEKKALEFLQASSPEVLLLPMEDMDFWFKALKAGAYPTIPIFFVERYEEAESLKDYGLREVNYIILPFNPMELLTKIVSISKETYEQAHLDYLGPVNLIFKFIRSGATLFLNIQGKENACTIYIYKGIVKGSSCDRKRITELIGEEVKVKLEPYKEGEPPYTFKDNQDFILSVVGSLVSQPAPIEVEREEVVEKPQAIEYTVDLSQPVQLSEGFYWVGVEDNKGLFQKNVYLRIYEKDDIKVPILINIGTFQDYAFIRAKLEQVVGTLDAVKGLILMDSGVDEASGVVNFLQSSQRAFVITSLSIAQKLKTFGIPMGRIRTIETFPSGRLRLATGHTLRFIPTPFLPEVGSFVVLEEEKGRLFTGKFLSSFRSIREFNPLMDAEVEDVLLYTSLNIPSKDILSLALKRITSANVLCVYPMFGNPILSEGTLKEVLDKLISAPNGFYELDKGVIFEICEDVLRLLEESKESDEVKSFFEDLNQFVYIEDTKISQVLVDVERLPSLMLGLMFAKGVDPIIVKEAIRRFYLAGFKLTI